MLTYFVGVTCLTLYNLIFFHLATYFFPLNTQCGLFVVITSIGFISVTALKLSERCATIKT